MAKYRNKPTVVEAKQWFRMGDVSPEMGSGFGFTSSNWDAERRRQFEAIFGTSKQGFPDDSSKFDNNQVIDIEAKEVAPESKRIE